MYGHPIVPTAVFIFGFQAWISCKILHNIVISKEKFDMMVDNPSSSPAASFWDLWRDTLHPHDVTISMHYNWNDANKEWTHIGICYGAYIKVTVRPRKKWKLTIKLYSCHTKWIWNIARELAYVQIYVLWNMVSNYTIMRGMPRTYTLVPRFIMYLIGTNRKRHRVTNGRTARWRECRACADVAFIRWYPIL